MTFLNGSYLGGVVESEYQEMADDLADINGDKNMDAARKAYEEMERTHAHHFGTKPNLPEERAQQIAQQTKTIQFSSSNQPSTGQSVASAITALPSKIADPGAPQLFQVQSRVEPIPRIPTLVQPPQLPAANITISADEKPKNNLTPILIGAAILSLFFLFMTRRG